MTAPQPIVVLVGAGPGAPDLLTVDAERALAAARFVVADRSLAPLLDALVAEGVLGALAAAGSRVAWVDDEQPAGDLLLDAVARAVVSMMASDSPGSVVRLYRGDPWFHPAGDAERASLTRGGVDWTSRPGVVEEIAALAAAGIPVQLRTVSVATTFLVDGPAAELALPADAAHALVVRTGDLVGAIDRLGRSVATSTDPDLIGRAAAVVGTCSIATSTCADLIGDATLAVVRSTLGELATAGAGLTGPGVVVVGLVAALDTRSIGSAAAAAAPQPVVQGARP